VEYQLGSELQYKDKTWRVIRVLSNDQSLFEDESGVYVILESYIQLKDAEGTIDFIVMNSEKLPYTGPASNIKALEPLQWRKP
jgi:hypothetical protein